MISSYIHPFSTAYCKISKKHSNETRTTQKKTKEQCFVLPKSSLLCLTSCSHTQLISALKPSITDVFPNIAIRLVLFFGLFFFFT